MNSLLSSVRACSGVLVTERRGVATDGSGQSSMSSSGLVPVRTHGAVQAAAIELAADGVEDRVGFVVAGARDREVAVARPAQPRIELAGDRQHGVAKRLGLQPLRRLPPEQAVVGIDRRGRFGIACATTADRRPT